MMLSERGCGASMGRLDDAAVWLRQLEGPATARDW